VKNSFEEVEIPNLTMGGMVSDMSSVLNEMLSFEAFFSDLSRTHDYQHLASSPLLIAMETCGVAVHNHVFSWLNKCVWVDLME
jgi:hypothetical protein